MLEQQQSKLVAGLQRLYSLLVNHEEWPGLPLKELNGGYPTVHDILDRLGVLCSEAVELQNRELLDNTAE
jgi:hypothetical protein